jgi:hypothetical protein
MLVEFWRWRYKDPVTGVVCKTEAYLTADEASVYPRAQRVPGTLQFREIEVDFTDTAPKVFFVADVKP